MRVRGPGEPRPRPREQTRTARVCGTARGLATGMLYMPGRRTRRSHMYPTLISRPSRSSFPLVWGAPCKTTTVWKLEYCSECGVYPLSTQPTWPASYTRLVYIIALWYSTTALHACMPSGWLGLLLWRRTHRFIEGHAGVEGVGVDAEEQ